MDPWDLSGLEEVRISEDLSYRVEVASKKRADGSPYYFWRYRFQKEERNARGRKKRGSIYGGTVETLSPEVKERYERSTNKAI